MDRFSANGFEVLDQRPFNDSMLKITLRCPLQHKFMAFPQKPHSGGFLQCPTCRNDEPEEIDIDLNEPIINVTPVHDAIILQKDVQYNMRKFCERHGLTLCSDIYAGSKKPHVWKCQFGHEFKCQFKTLKQRADSPRSSIICVHCEIRTFRASHGLIPISGTRVDTNRNTIIEWRCIRCKSVCNGRLINMPTCRKCADD
jgi:hypothetical protein